jgi:2,5-dihydroxypyridine 5,6-dioxygenase
LAELALSQIGARIFHVVLPTPPHSAPVPVRSTGASHALAGIVPVIDALGAASFVADLTVEGLLHAPELPAILERGSRVLYISNEHPEILERLKPDAKVREAALAGLALLQRARTMRVTSEAGTDLEIDVRDAPGGAGGGFSDAPGTIDHWPGGLVACFPAANAVNGTLVLDVGDVNLTFKRYLERPVRLRIENDYAVSVEGDGLDAELMRSYFAAWGDREAYATSHVGWGMNPAARWDALVMYDKNDTNGTELRAFAGNFLYSAGANLRAGRETLGHFDLPLRNCTVALDDVEVVRRGVVNLDALSGGEAAAAGGFAS